MHIGANDTYAHPTTMQLYDILTVNKHTIKKRHYLFNYQKENLPDGAGRFLRCLIRTRVYNFHKTSIRISVPSQQITYKSITYAGQATPKLCREGEALPHSLPEDMHIFGEAISNSYSLMRMV